MSVPPAIKTWIKEHVPASVVRPLRTGAAVMRGYRYWVPYNTYGDGRAWPPSMLTLDLTYICNLKCEMCPQAIDFEKKTESNLLKQYKANKELSTEQILCLVDDAAAFGVKTFTLTGGEPFLRKDIFSMIERIKARGMACQIYTNGMLITPSYAERLVALGVDRITISVDGPEQVHNAIRKNSRSFQKLIDAVRLLRAEQKRQGVRHPSLLFYNTVSASNLRYMGELTAIAGELGVDINFGYMYYVTEAMEAETAAILQTEPVKGEDQNMPDALKRFDRSVVERQIRDVRQKEREAGINVHFMPDLKPRDVLRRYEDDRFAATGKCFYAWDHARVNPYGDLYACGPISVSMGNVTERGLAAIWNNEPFRAFRRQLRSHRLLPKCAKCCALNETAWRYLPALRW